MAAAKHNRQSAGSQLGERAAAGPDPVQSEHAATLPSHDIVAGPLPLLTQPMVEWATILFVAAADEFQEVGSSTTVGKNVVKALTAALPSNVNRIRELLADQPSKAIRVRCHGLALADTHGWPIAETLHKFLANEGQYTSLDVPSGFCTFELTEAQESWHGSTVTTLDPKAARQRADQTLGGELGRLIEDTAIHLGRASLTATEKGAPSFADLLLFFNRLNVGLDSFQVHAIDALQTYLGRLTGTSFDSIESNIAFAKSLQLMATRLRIRVCCPQCGEPSILRFHQVGRARQWVYQFEHSSQGKKTHHNASATIPELKLVSAKPDGRARD